MFRNIPVVPRLVGAVAVGGTLVTGLTLGLVHLEVGEALNQAEHRELRGAFLEVQTAIAQRGLEARRLSALVASLPPVQAAVARGDRGELASLFLPGFPDLAKDHGVRQFQFHTPPAKSLFRVHRPDKHGDDLSGFRSTVVETNRSRQPVSGLEAGVAGLGIRGLVPVRHDGAHVGSVEFGLSFGQPFLEEHAARHDVELALHLAQGGRVEPLASTLNESGLLDANTLAAVLGSGPVLERMQHDGRPVSVYAAPINDYSGRPVAVLQVMADRGFYLGALSQVQTYMIALGGGGLLLGLLAVTWLILNVVRPLRRTAGSMLELAEGAGDLTRRLDESGKDEVADLARGFNRFLAHVADLVKQVSECASEASVTAASLAGTATHASDGMRSQQQETAQIATAMNEMSATVHEVARHAAEAADAAQSAGGEAGRGREVVAEAIEGIRQLAQEVHRAGETVQRVHDDSDQISTVLAVIRGVAEQTNLLALNAAIEAARAGEQGRGFAVVADEVRQLAGRTQDSTREIEAMVTRLESSVGEAVDVIGQSRDRAEATVAQADQVGSTLEGISGAVNAIVSMSQQIATAAEEQSQVAEEINRGVSTVRDLSDQASQDAEETSRASTGLASATEKLVELVGRFRVEEDSHRTALGHARVRHLAWKSKALRFLRGDDSLREQILVNEHQCGFGRWYDQERAALAHIPEMARIAGPHGELHRSLRRIAELKARGDAAGAEAEYARIGPLSDEVVALIDRIMERL